MKNIKPEMTPFILGLLCFVVSIVFVVDGVERQREYQIIKDNLISITATVSSISVLEDNDGQDSYTACVAYVYDGKSYHNKGWKGMSKGEYCIGQEVEILINPNEPGMPYIYTGNIFGHLGGSCVFLLLGLVFIVYSFHKKD